MAHLFPNLQSSFPASCLRTLSSLIQKSSSKCEHSSDDKRGEKQTKHQTKSKTKKTKKETVSPMEAPAAYS